MDIPGALCRSGRGHGLLQSPSPLPKIPAAPKSPLGCFLQQRRRGRGERGLSCPTAGLGAAQAELHSACRRHSKRACAKDQQGYPQVPSPGPRAGTGSNSAGVGPEASWGLPATSPSSTAPALHRALVSFSTVSPTSPALGSATAHAKLRPPGGTNPPLTHPVSLLWAALLLQGDLGAPCDFEGAFLCRMLGRKQAPQPRENCLSKAQPHRQKLKPIPGRSAPATATQCHRTARAASRQAAVELTSHQAREARDEVMAVTS